MKTFLINLFFILISNYATAQTTDFEVNVHQDMTISCNNETVISHGRKLTEKLDLIANKAVQESYCTLSCTGGKELNLKMGQVIKDSKNTLIFDGIFTNNYSHFPIYLENSPYTLWINCHTGAGVALLELGKFDIGNVNSQLQGYLHINRVYTLGVQNDSNKKVIENSKVTNPNQLNKAKENILK